MIFSLKHSPLNFNLSPVFSKVTVFSRAIVLLLAVISLLATAPAYAQKVKVKRIGYMDLVAQYNPLGLAVIAGASRRGVFDSGENELFDRHYVQAGIESLTSPAGQSLSLKLEYQPHPFFNLDIEYGASYFFGIFGGFYSYDSPIEPYGDGDEPTEEAVFQTHYQIAPTFTLALGNFIARNETRYWVGEFDSKRQYGHDPIQDLLFESGEPIVTNITDMSLLAFGRKGGVSSLGVYQEFSQAQDSELFHRRVGLQLFEQLPGKKFGIKNPRFYIQIGRHLEDRNRDDTFYFTAGFGLEWRMR